MRIRATCLASILHKLCKPSLHNYPYRCPRIVPMHIKALWTTLGSLGDNDNGRGVRNAGTQDELLSSKLTAGLATLLDSMT